MDETQFNRYTQVAAEAAREAGEIIRSHISGPISIKNKGRVDLVTEVDLMAEKLILTKIRKEFPHHRIVAEESGGQEDMTGPTWFIDPLDGTTNFTHAYPQCSVSIALRIGGQMIMGTVYDPLRDELFQALQGQGATLNSNPLAVSETAVLFESLLASGFPYNLEDRSYAHALVGLFLPRIQGFRRDGSAALNLCWVAAGRLDGYWEFSIRPWDIAAGSLIATEAGGLVSGFAGEPLDLYGSRIVAANRLIHPQIVKILETAQIKFPAV